jgi:hypothetical protein
MYYTGNGASIGLAFSKDLIHWQKYAGNPVLVAGPGAFDNVSVRYPSVLLANGLYQMWYVGRAQNHTVSISYATSTDGLRWVKNAANPVLSNQKLPPRNSLGPRDESVVKFQSGYLMTLFYGGNVTYAVSGDGISWTSNADPLVENAGNTTQSDFPSALASADSLTMWVTTFSSPGQPVVNAVTCGILIIPTVNTVTSFSTATTTNEVAVTVTSVSTETNMQAEGASAGLSATLAVLLVVMTAMAVWFYRGAQRRARERLP